MRTQVNSPGKIQKLLMLVIFSTGITCSSFGQADKTIDSLLNYLKTATGDTNRVHALNALGSRYVQTSRFTDAKKYADEALELGQKLNFKRGVAVAYSTIASLYRQQNNYPEVLSNLIASLRRWEEIGDLKGLTGVNKNIGAVYWEQGNLPKATQYYLAALKSDEQMGDKAGMAMGYMSIGQINQAQGNNSEAIKNFQTALQLAKASGDKRRIAHVMMALGNFYCETAHPAEALNFYREAIPLYEEVGARSSVKDLYFNIGFVNLSQSNYTEALKNHQAALGICREIKDEMGIASGYGNIGDVYFSQGRATSNSDQKRPFMNKALENYLLAYENFKKLGNKSTLAVSSNQLGAAYIELKKFNEAKIILREGLAVSKQIGLMNVTKDIYRNLAVLDSCTGNWEAAFKDYQSYVFYRDSIAGEENTKNVVKAQMQFEFDKKEDSLNYLQLLTGEQLKQQKQAKNYLITGLALFAILSFFVYRNYRTRQQLRLQEIRNKIASDLHDDIGSTLSSISMFSQLALQDSEEIKPMLQSIGESSGRMLDAMADIVWTINPENDQFENIILRMRNFAYELLGAKKIEFRFMADENIANIRLPMETRRNLYLIFKEATNNLVKYAEASEAMFSIKEKDDKVMMMMIEDNGKGFEQNRATEGNGLKNMKKRASEIGANLEINSIPGNGTQIKLELAV